MVGDDIGEGIAGKRAHRAAIHQDASYGIAAIGGDGKGPVVTIVDRHIPRR